MTDQTAATKTATALPNRVHPSMEHPEYNANGLLDTVIARLQVRNDARLAEKLGVRPPVISKIRHKKLALCAGMMIRIHDATDMTLNEIRSFLGLPLGPQAA